MDYFDLHCDTATEIFKRRVKLYDNPLHISLKKAGHIEKYAQIAAFWSDPRYSGDECFDLFGKTLDHFTAELSENGLAPVTDTDAFEKYQNAGLPAFIIGVEGAGLLNRDISRLDDMYRRGVRGITLTWKGVSCIGGAFDTDEGLSPFGADTVIRMGELNVACDLSHAGVKTANDALSLVKAKGYPVFCSHSNAYSLCRHPRCISDGFAKELSLAGGICGVSFVPYHLTEDKICTAETVVSHILHLRNIAGGDFPAVGGDFDGVDRLPEGISDISDVTLICDLLKKHGLSDGETEKILYGNAKRFLSRILTKKA